jgi:nucleotide-binding universal stress UspA family protein
MMMTYATLMVHLELGVSNAGLLRVAGDLADRCHASVVGVGVCRPVQNVYANIGDSYITGEIAEFDREEIEREAKAAEAEFRDAMKEHAKQVEWRSAVMFSALSGYLAMQSRCADLIITGVSSAALANAARRSDTANLILQAGRPVLIAPQAGGKLRLERIVIGWKDTREARRAALDALPLLKWASHVAVVEIARESELAAARARLDDVVAWLGRHGVTASPIAARSQGADAAELNEIVQRQGADLIVAGAYGHDRVREWALGGVTRDLLLCADRCALVSH